MKRFAACVIIAVFLLLLFGSTASAFRTAGIVSPQQYYSFGSTQKSGLWSSTSGGNIFFSFGKKDNNLGVFGDSFLKIDFPQTSVQFSEWSTTPQKAPTIKLTELPGPNWSPSFTAP